MTGDRPAPIRLGAGFGALAPGSDPLPVEVVLNVLRAAALLEARFAPVFERHRLSSNGYAVLESLANHPEPLTPTDLSRRMLTPPQTLTHQLDRLERAGLVARDRHPQDRRSVLVTLTPSGRDLLLDVTRELIPMDAALLADIPRSEQDTLVGLLGAVQAACGQGSGV